MIFRSKPLVSDDLAAWIDDNFAWVQDNRPRWLERAQLIEPTDAFFPPRGETDAQTARAVFDSIAKQLGVKQKFALAPLQTLPEQYRHSYQRTASIAGQFRQGRGKPLSAYDPALLGMPIVFANMAVHEVMHFRLADVANDLPGGWEAHELATDLHCIIAGYGVIQMQAADLAGWAGYMTQTSRAVALARFLTRKQIDPKTALQYLSRRPRRWLRKALKTAS